MNRVALITGGGRGIGLGVSKALAREGFNLAICGRRDPDQLTQTLDELQQAKIVADYCRADISQAKDRDKLIEFVRQRFGRLDVLVNNAGVAPQQRRDILECTEESYQRVMRINLQGPFFLTQAVANWMIEQRKASDDFSGCVITISSVSATMASVNRGEYCVSKAGLSMASRLWAVRLAEFGISVYEIQPGIVQTDMTAGVRQMYDRRIENGLLLQPQWGTPEQIGQAVAMLARGDLPYSTGQIIAVDGGMTVPRL